MKIFSNIQTDLKTESLLKNPPFSNWAKSPESRERLEKLVEEVIEKVKSYSLPRAIINILRREETDIEKYRPPETLLESDFLAVGVVTIGEHADINPKGANLTEAIITDALENVALIQAERVIVEFIKGMAEEEDLNTTRILPPGSGRIKWGTENQEFIFKNLDASKIGVRLNPSFVMIPRKSVSFVIGLGRNIEQAKNMYSCDGCKRLDCPYRT